VAVQAEPNVSPSDNAGAAYLSLIQQQVESEDRRKQSLEQRGLALVTISAFLSSVLFALAAWALATGDIQPSVWAQVVALLAVIAFLGAAVWGMATAWTRSYTEVKPEALERLLEERYWRAGAAIGTRRAGEVLVTVLKDAREQNNSKAEHLQAGLLFAGVAAALVAVSALLVLAQV
jgi:hypothetical protein